MPLRLLPVLLLCTLTLVAPLRAAEFETKARHAIILDYESGQTLFERDADQPIPTASMSKLMTIYMLLERIQSGALSLDDTFPVSEKAWKKGGSKMFVEVGKQVRVEDLLRGIIIQSGNDASIVVAEALAGSEEAFAEQMTRRARELGLENTELRNATGWPDPEHRMSVRDLAKVAMLTIRNFPDYYPIFAEKSFTYSDITQRNRNPLLYRSIGADGLKTGHTENAGYGLTASARRGDQRLVMVVAGLESSRERGDEAERLLRWAFRTFATYRLGSAGETISDAEVWLGQSTRVPLMLGDDLLVSMARADRARMKVEAVYDGPVPAPVSKGQQVGRLVVTADGRQLASAPLLAADDVAPLGPLGRIGAALAHVIWGSGG